MNIYEQVISKQNEVIATKAEGVDSTEKMGELLTLLMDNFAGDANLEDVSQIFDMSNVREEHEKHINTLNIDNIKSLDKAVVPVAVVRYLLAPMRIAFNSKNCASWDRFSARYGEIILAA